MRMDSQYRSFGRRDPSGPPRRERSASERLLLAFLAAAYALTALAAPFAHAHELQGGVLPGATVAGATALPAGTQLDAPVPGEDAPLHDELDCLTCAFLALAGAPVAPDAERHLPGSSPGATLADAPVHPGATLLPPNSRGPPTAA